MSQIALNGIKTALQYATCLSVLADDYTSILNLAKSRGVKVSIFILNNGAINVPAEFLEENRKYLNVKKVGKFDSEALINTFKNN